MSFPFFGKAFKFVEADGAQVEVVGTGDQHGALFETPDGYQVVMDPASRRLCYVTSPDGTTFSSSGVRATTPAPKLLEAHRGLRFARAAVTAADDPRFGLGRGTRRCDLRRILAKSALYGSVAGLHAAPPKRETVGVYRGLCLLIEFPDVKGTISREEVEQFCNKEGYRGFGNNGSVRDYFFDNSCGKLEYTNAVTKYYTAKNPVAYYTDPKVAYPVRARELVTEALTDLIQSNFDFTQLTADQEGYIYAVNVFYAGTCRNNWSQGLWPHSSRLNAPVFNDVGYKAFDYQITDMGTELALGTFCHENGHMICDFPDLYDYGYESNGIGAFCLMCAGGNADPKNPTQICAYLKHEAGWGRIVPLGDSNQITAAGNMFFKHAKDAREYFLLECRAKAQRDVSLPAAGLAIWHVDELGSNNDEQMTPPKHYECALEQADGRFDLEHRANLGDRMDLFFAGNKDVFSPVTTPSAKWWDGSSANLELTGISAPGATMYFTAKVL